MRTQKKSVLKKIFKMCFLSGFLVLWDEMPKRGPAVRIVTRTWSWVRPAGNAELYFLPYIVLLRLTTTVVIRSAVSPCDAESIIQGGRFDRKEYSDKNRYFLSTSVVTTYYPYHLSKMPTSLLTLYSKSWYYNILSPIGDLWSMLFEN